MRMIIRSMMAASLVAAASSASAQATHPSFAGTWVLNVAKSQSTQALPDSGTWTIAQHGDTIEMDRVSSSAAIGTVKIHFVVAADGKEWKNTMTQPSIGEIQTGSTATWDGAVLVTNTGFQIQGTDILQVERWTLSADGKTIVAERKFSAGGQDIASSTLTFDRKS